VHDDVLELEVAMYDSLPVKIFGSVADLQNDLLGFILGKALALLDSVVELAVTAQLQEEVDVFLVAEVAVHASDVEVVQEALYFQLADDLVLQLLILQYTLVNYLYCAREAQLHVLGQVYVTKLSLS